MGESNVNLAALVGSRICHDLISPIGAVTNGLELLDLAGAVQGAEMNLIADSIGSAGARIRFFRIAYGAAGDQLLGPAEVRSVLDDVGRGDRYRAIWAPLEPQPRAEVRLAFLALQCCETAMPFGGEVRIDVDGGQWTVLAQAEKLKIDSDLWGGLDSAQARTDVTPATVQFALLANLASDLDRRIETTIGEREIAIRF